MAVKIKPPKSIPRMKPPIAPPVKDLAAPTNGSGSRPDNIQSRMFDEAGSSGLNAWYGFVYQAYNAELYWPDVYELYNRIRRSDPEVTITRQIFGTIGSHVRIEPDLPEDPSDDDKRFQEFYAQVLEDVEGGIGRWRDTFIAYVPFMGWGWWEAVPAVRKLNWVPPDDDPWRSQYDDGLIGFRRFAHRDHSSFDSWIFNETNGRLAGMWQSALPHPRVPLPIENSIHVTFGDVENPEGLTPSESLWRLERLKYGLEIVQGIGFEHAAGHLSVTKTQPGELTSGDKTNIKAAARSILTAQEGNYAAWPFGFTGQVMDVPFSAAPSILAAIQHYSMLKLALFNMQWVAMSTVSDTGSYAALKDSTALWLVAFNNMLANGVSQLDEQIGPRLLTLNAGKFANITRRPKLKTGKIEKLIDLQELGAFMQTIKEVLPLGDDDYLEFRKRSGFLPEVLPQAEESTPDTSGELASLTSAVNEARRELAQSRTQTTQPAPQAKPADDREAIQFQIMPGAVNVPKPDMKPIAEAISQVEKRIEQKTKGLIDKAMRDLEVRDLAMKTFEPPPPAPPPDIVVQSPPVDLSPIVNAIERLDARLTQLTAPRLSQRVKRKIKTVKHGPDKLMTGIETRLEYEDVLASPLAPEPRVTTETEVVTRAGDNTLTSTETELEYQE